MSRFAKVGLAVWLATMVSWLPVATYAENTDPSSNALTQYLHEHRLPLVQAEVVDSEEGGRQVILYGFVATEYGKQDAQEKTKTYLNDPNVEVVNRIKVRPELASLGHRNSMATTPPSSTPPEPRAANQNPDVQAYERQQQADFMTQPQSPGSAAPDLLTLLIFGAIMGMGVSGGSSGFGVGFGPSYGTGYGPMYSSPYSSPYGRPRYDPFGNTYNPGPFYYGPNSSFGYDPYSSYP